LMTCFRCLQRLVQPLNQILTYCTYKNAALADMSLNFNVYITEIEVLSPSCC
jgi:hypothetical protein